jgi:CubicO group peptidase (beta-lactamase class C family)
VRFPNLTPLSYGPRGADARRCTGIFDKFRRPFALYITAGRCREQVRETRWTHFSLSDPSGNRKEEEMNLQVQSPAQQHRRTFIRTSAASVAAAVLMPRPAKAEIGAMGSKLVSRLKNQCVGYQFTISDQFGAVYKAAGGEARRLQDSPTLNMSTSVKFNVASVSKVITAAALIRLLWNTSGISLNSPFVFCLPPHWTVHSSLKNITFKQLLNHTSGFRFPPNDADYFNLKADMAKGVLTSDIGKPEYNNANYALMRLLILCGC